MTSSLIRRVVRSLPLVATCCALSACELIADFDRGKLETPTPDSGYAIPPEPDGSIDTSIHNHDSMTFMNEA